MAHQGELAALATAIFWAVTSIFFSEAGKRIGSFNVNKIRLVMAVAIYSILLTFTTGSPVPAGVNKHEIFWLGLSGFVGLVIGDSCGFKALVMIGPRLMTLLYSTAPIMASIVAWVFLGEKLKPVDLLGISVTMAGVAWVITEKRSQNKNSSVSHEHPDQGSFRRGILLGFGAALGQALGLVLAKKGMLHAGGTVSAMPASFIRMVTATLSIWTISAFRGKLGGVVTALKDSKAIRLCFGGTFFGPFLGVWMSLVALQYISTGVAATLNATTPVMIIPLVMIYYKERVSIRAITGALLAVSGVTILFLA